MDILITVIIAGMAVGYLTEVVSMFWGGPLVTVLLTLTLSLAATWLLGIHDIRLAVATPAAGFFAAFVLKLATRPVVVNNARRG